MTAPEWTATPPTEPGWYWWTPDIEDGDKNPTLIEVDHCMEVNHSFGGLLWGDTYTKIKDVPRSVLWCGPISPPELPGNL